MIRTQSPRRICLAPPAIRILRRAVRRGRSPRRGLPAAWFLAAAVAAQPLEGNAAMKLLIGGHAHGTENIRALADLGVGNFVWIPARGYTMGNTPWNDEHDIFADVDACIERGLSFMITERRGLGAVERGGGFPRGGHCSVDYHDRRTVLEIARRAGDLFVGLHAEELDADLLQQMIRPIFQARTPSGWAYTDRAGGRRAFEAELLRQKNLYDAFGAAYIPNVCVTHHLSAFRIGADLPIAELFEHLTTTELQLALMRGGARQFGRDWGVWVSPWFWGQVPCEDKELWPAKPAQPGGGHSVSEFRRALYLSFVSGARLITMQETEPIFSRDPGGGYRLAAWGKELKGLWEYARGHDEPMRPLVPLAVMVDEDHGWEPPHLWQNWNLRESVWGRLPIEPRADGMFREYVNLLLPGFMRTAESVRERTDIYPGYFAATPLGPFDIVAADIDAERLRAYPAVVLLGRIDMNPGLRRTLRDYVAGGGTLLLNVYHLLDERGVFQEDEAFLGVRISGDPQWHYGEVIYAGSKIRLLRPIPGMDRTEYDEPFFASCRVLRRDAEIVAVDENDRPVLLRKRFGRGQVWMATPEYMLEGWGGQTAPLSFFRDWIAATARRGPVAVDNPGDVSWVASRQGTGSVVVALANHGASAAEARVRGRDGIGNPRVEIGEGRIRPDDADGQSSFTVRIPPEDVVVVRFDAPGLPEEE